MPEKDGTPERLVREAWKRCAMRVEKIKNPADAAKVKNDVLKEFQHVIRQNYIKFIFLWFPEQPGAE